MSTESKKSGSGGQGDGHGAAGAPLAAVKAGPASSTEAAAGVTAAGAGAASGPAAAAAAAAGVTAAEPPKPDVDRTQIRYLTPDNCRIHLGTLGALHITIKGEGIWGGLYTAYAFPVAYPNGFISIVQTAGDQDTELGIIRDIDEFPPADAALVRQALRRRYFIHVITKLKSITMKYNMLYFDVETDKGSVSFFMRWAQDRAVDYGQTGKVLIDVDENRYLIPDVEALPARERTDFTRYIYW